MEMTSVKEGIKVKYIGPDEVLEDSSSHLSDLIRVLFKHDFSR